MSKSIIIQQSGFPEALTVDALRTGMQGSGSEDWLPADGKNLIELDISGSGTYRASDYGAYGISVARVYPKVGGGATSKAAQQHEFGNLHIPSIHEGGKPVLLSARMVKTNLQGGGSYLWVPEDEVNLDTKYVDHSGTYSARADGCYGYSQITVSGVDVEITQDEDGDDVAKITDGDTVTEEKLPNEIRIEREPYFVGPYGVGAYISFDGLIVKAYTRSGKHWTDETHPDGIIPISELTLPVTTVGDEVSYYATSDLVDAPIPFTRTKAVITYENYWGQTEFVTYTVGQYEGSEIIVTSWTSGSDWHFITWAGKEPFSGGNQSYTYNGKTVIYHGLNDNAHGVTITGFPESTPDYSGKAFWTCLYGDTYGGQSVPVQWARPYDGQVLENQFSVEVIDIRPNGYGED